MLLLNIFAFKLAHPILYRFFRPCAGERSKVIKATEEINLAQDEARQVDRYAVAWRRKRSIVEIINQDPARRFARTYVVVGTSVCFSVCLSLYTRCHWSIRSLKAYSAVIDGTLRERGKEKGILGSR